MKPISENVVIQIEITNACHLSCANCSRLVGHHRKPFFMTPYQVRDAIRSLDGFPGRIDHMYLILTFFIFPAMQFIFIHIFQ